jgi:hypothetical protein
MAGPMPEYRHRPTAVLVMAILNFIWGGLGIICLSCGAAMLLMMNSLFKSIPPPPGGGPNPATAFTGLFDSIPGYIPYMVATTIIGVCMAILLIVAGIGLINMQPWARWACLIYSTYHILAALFTLFYTITVVNPAMRKWQADFMRQAGVVGPPPSSGFGGIGDSMSAIAGAVFSMAYAVALLVVMLLPHVSAAFAGKGSPDTGQWPPPDYPPDRPDSGPGDPYGGDAFRSGDPRWR